MVSTTETNVNFRIEQAFSEPESTPAAMERPTSYCIFREPWWLDAVAPGAWREIMRSKARSVEFDMTGSMVESIERFFRAFGGQQRVYFSLNKMSRRARFAWYGKKMIQALFNK